MKKPPVPTDQRGRPLTKITKIDASGPGSYGERTGRAQRTERPGGPTPKGSRTWEKVPPPDHSAYGPR